MANKVCNNNINNNNDLLPNNNLPRKHVLLGWPRTAHNDKCHYIDTSKDEVLEEKWGHFRLK